MTKTKVNHQNNNCIQVIIGSTATGKSAAAIKLAEQLNGVIINCDAMQSYDALHVLTAQPSQEEQAAIPHKLYGHLHPAKHYSAGEWRDDAINAIDDCFAQNQTPIICGGTGFYLKALMEGLSPVPETPKHIREDVIALHKNIGTEKLFDYLSKHDPDTAGKIDRHNPARLMRAIEVLKHTGRSLSDWQKEPLSGPPKGWTFDVTVIPLGDRELHRKKIEKRLHDMIDQGILDEVRALDQRIQGGEVPSDALIVKAHGFRAFRDYLDNKITRDDAFERTALETAQYAKRQMTWMRGQKFISE